MLVFYWVLLEFPANQLLYLLENFYIVLSYQSNCASSPSCSSSSAHAMHVVFAIAWNVKVDNHVYRWNVKTPRSDVSCNQNTSLTSLKLVQRVQSHLLGHLAVDVYCFEV